MLESDEEPISYYRGVVLRVIARFSRFRVLLRGIALFSLPPWFG